MDCCYVYFLGMYLFDRSFIGMRYKKETLGGRYELLFVNYGNHFKTFRMVYKLFEENLLLFYSNLENKKD